MIVSADLAGAELYVSSLLARDRPFLDKFERGQSPHFDTARALFGCEIPKGDPRYTFSKSLTFKWIYTIPGASIPEDGGGLNLYKVGLTAEAVAPMVARLDSAHPAMVQRKHRVIEELQRTGKVYCPFGSYRNLNWAVRSWDRKLQTHAKQAALNYPIQRTITWIMNRAFVQIDQAIQDAGWPSDEGLALPEHDSLGIYCLPERVEQAARFLKEGMEQPVPELGGARMTAEVKVGESWGTVKPIEVPSVQTGNPKAA